MRVGVVARADNRGLGNQTWEAARHLDPAVVLVVSMGPLSPYDEHPRRYVDVPVRVPATFDGERLQDEAIDRFLDGCDVVYTAETPYDYRLLERARERGVATVVQGNYEFLKWRTEPDLPRPDLFLSPSTWHLEEWPEPTVHLPFPVDRERLPFHRRTGARRFLHVVGHKAMRDRNGTRLVLDAARFVRSDVELVVRSQSRVAAASPYQAHPARVVVEQADLENYWEVYAGCDALLAPRRFGGQSLPINEALSLGMPVVSIDVEPQRGLLAPEGLVRPIRQRPLRTQGGDVECWTCAPRELAAAIDRLAGDGALVARMSDAADEVAGARSWEALAPQYRAALERAVDTARSAAA